ncbi:MAG: response regulator transcription factor [Lachnospiraceae bacterium]|nr:response regulator transcription factor [Lachnospiraceae bacterium]
MYNVLVVEDSKIAKDMVERMLSQSEDYNMVAAIENAANAAIICVRNKIDLILMDVVTAGDESGLEAAADIKQKYPSIKIIIMTSMPEVSFMDKARAAGVESFWYKEYGSEDLINVCDRTMNGEHVWPMEKPVIKVGDIDSVEFTDREVEVIRALTLGLKYEEIADQLYISTNTVKFHIKNILQKTGFHSTLQLVTEVVSKRLILPKF